MLSRLLCVVLLASACKSVTPSAPTPDLSTPGAAVRPYGLYVPPSLDTSQPQPLVVLLHGYGANSATQDAYFLMTSLANQKGFYLALPEGTVDPGGSQFWNATDACCNFYDSAVDDVANLVALIADASATNKIDAKRVFLWGHSNGGFMAHRFACDHAELVAGIVSLAGAQWTDAARCTPSSTQKVAVLQVHGTSDAIIKYAGGDLSVINASSKRVYPSATATVATWAQKNGCGAALVDSGATLDLERNLPGAETKIERHDCPSGGASELWTITNGSHVRR